MHFFTFPMKDGTAFAVYYNVIKTQQNMRDIKTDLADNKLMDALTKQARNNRGIAEDFIYLAHCYLTDDDLAETADYESYGDDPYDYFDDRVRTWSDEPNADMVLNMLAVFGGLRGESWRDGIGNLADMFVVYYNHLKGVA